MEKNAIEKLNALILTKNSRIVAGLDPTWDIIPKKYYHYEKVNQDEIFDEINIKTCFQQFCFDYIKVVRNYVPAIKINSAFFEERKYHKMYFQIAEYARKSGLIVIGDVKRADIGSTSRAYAEAYLGKNAPFDAITVNPYFGTDSVKPFLDLAVENGKAVFILVKTSNPSSKDIQDLVFDDGNCVYETIADFVNMWGNNYESDSDGYNPIGAVVGATHPEQAAELRKRMPNTFFLVPGFGAQGATADDVSVNFDSKGLGAIVNSSRGLMCAYKKEKYAEFGEERWMEATAAELQNSIREINEAVKRYNAK